MRDIFLQTPRYRIRPLTEQEQQQSLSKEVKELWNYESSLLANYKKFLQILEQIVRSYAKSTDPILLNLATVSVRCMCELLSTHPQFNFRSNIIATLVPLSDYPSNEVRNIS